MNGTQEDTGLMVQDTAPDALARVGPMQQMRSQYATAISVQRPRELPSIEKKFLDEAAVAGASFFYGWGAGKDRIEGATVDLAMALVRTWGNCAVEMQPIQETYESWIFTAAFVDLETGFTLMRQFRQSKNWTVHGKFDEARKEDIRFQIGQSKAIRNVVLNALPKWLANKGVDAAKQNVRGLIEKAIEKKGHEEIKKLAVKRLADNKIAEAQVLAKFGRATVAALTVEDLVIIHGDVAALENGLDTPDNVYPPIVVQNNSNDGRSASQRLADKMGGKTGDTTSGTDADDPPKSDSETAPPETDDLSIREGESAEQYTGRLKAEIGNAASDGRLDALEQAADRAIATQWISDDQRKALGRALTTRAKLLNDKPEGSLLA